MNPKWGNGERRQPFWGYRFLGVRESVYVCKSVRLSVHIYHGWREGNRYLTGYYFISFLEWKSKASFKLTWEIIRFLFIRTGKFTHNSFIYLIFISIRKLFNHCTNKNISKVLPVTRLWYIAK